MERILKGGSAVMLDVEGLDFDNGGQYHCTLQFVGRDLPVEYAGAVVAAATLVPSLSLRSTGHCRVFKTSKGSYLVLEIDRTSELTAARDEFRGRLLCTGVRIRDDFEWSPHITINEGRPGTVFAVPEPVAPFDIRVTSVTVKLGDQKLRFAL